MSCTGGITCPCDHCAKLDPGAEEQPEAFGPATDFADLPRDEKQMAYQLWKAAQPVESKMERRLRRNHMLSKFSLRHSQIRAAAKKRGKAIAKTKLAKLNERRYRALDRHKAAMTALYGEAA